MESLAFDISITKIQAKKILENGFNKEFNFDIIGKSSSKSEYIEKVDDLDDFDTYDIWLDNYDWKNYVNYLIQKYFKDESN